MKGVRNPVDKREPRHRAKLLLRLTLAGVVAIVGMGVLILASHVMAALTSENATTQVFNAAAELPPDLLAAVTWKPDPTDLPRPMEPLTRVDVTSSWLRAWSQLNILAETGDTTGLETYFSNSALIAATAAAEQTNGYPVHQLGHDLRLTFYSEDGQVIGLSSDSTRVLRQASVGDGLAYFDSEETYEAVLLLEDGNWRVQHWVRRSVDGAWTGQAIPAGTSPAPTEANGFRYQLQLGVEGAVPASVEADFARGKALGFDTVRLQLNQDDFVSVDREVVNLAGLEMVLDLAGEAELQVLLVLFDAKQDHGPSRWTQDVRYLETVVPLLSTHPSVILYDLAAATDGNFAGDPDRVYSWLGHVGRSVRSMDEATPIAVIWASADAAVQAPPTGDVIAFSYPIGIDGAAQRAEVLKAHDSRPVLAMQEASLPLEE